MTIDINELRDRARTGSVLALDYKMVIELLDRLEEAEKERNDFAQQLVQSEIGKREISEAHDALRAELSKQQALTDAAQHIAEVAQSRANRLQAKITEMERQEPVKYERRIKRRSDHTWGYWRECYKIDYVKAKATGGYFPKFSDDLFDYEVRPLYALPGAQGEKK